MGFLAPIHFSKSTFSLRFTTMILSYVLLSAAESPSTTCFRGITVTFPTILLNVPLDGLSSFFGQQVQELCELLDVECEPPVVEGGTAAPYTFNVNGVASVYFVMDGVTQNPSVCLWDWAASLFDSAAASDIDAECSRQAALACHSAGIAEGSAEYEKIRDALRSAARTQLEGVSVAKREMTFEGASCVR
jgi:hypothetical protein